MSEIHSMDGEINHIPPNCEVMLTRRAAFPSAGVFEWTAPSSEGEQL